MSTRYPRSIAELRRWLAAAPAGTTVPAAAVLAALEDVPAAPEPTPPPPAVQIAPLPWSVLLWMVPAETRLTRAQLMEALGRSEHFIYRRTQSKAPDRIPCRRFAGELVFVAGEIREWLREHEELLHVGPITPASSARDQGLRLPPVTAGGA